MKPFPVSFFDKNFKNSFGVIMDDVCAGFFVVLTIFCFMVIKCEHHNVQLKLQDM